MRSLSHVAHRLTGQPMFGLLARSREMESQGKEIFHFEIGDPSFESPAPAVEAAKSALDSGLTHYTDSTGTREFREAVQGYVERHRGFRPRLNQVLICPANAAIDFTVRCLANPCDEVIYPDPGFPTYHSVLTYNGMTPVPLPLREQNGFRLDLSDLNRRITDKTKLVIINSPQNPTGAVMSRQAIMAVAEIARERDVFLLSDEVYSRIIYDERHYSPSLVDQCRERIILLDSLSKVHSMSGWRLGFVVGPEELIEKMGLLLQTILSCLPAFTQAGGVAALKSDDRTLCEQICTLRKRRDTLVKGLNGLPGMSCVEPEGAFYAFANISRTGMSSTEYSDCLLRETGVCVLPGTCFGEYGRDYVRLCYASTTIEMIEAALLRMKTFHSGCEDCRGIVGITKTKLRTERVSPSELAI